VVLKLLITNNSRYEVWRGIMEDGNYIIAKILRDSYDSQAYNEANLLRNELKGCSVAPQLVCFGVYKDSNEMENIVIVTKPVGKETLYNRVNRNEVMELNTICIIGKQLIEALKLIHSKNVCHRDITPMNIIFIDEIQVLLIDFGFATGINFRTLDCYCGTKKYVSANWHMFVKRMSHRIPGIWDDLESLFYTLIFCWRGHLNWKLNNSSHYCAKIELLQNPSNLPVPLRRMASYIYSNSYLSLKEINYEELESIFLT